MFLDATRECRYAHAPRFMGKPSDLVLVILAVILGSSPRPWPFFELPVVSRTNVAEPGVIQIGAQNLMVSFSHIPDKSSIFGGQIARDTTFDSAMSRANCRIGQRLSMGNITGGTEIETGSV